VTARRLLAAAAAVLVVALLFVAYLRMSRTYPENSDESNDLLMAWDMLHGNVLLHGWYLSDVSFITTELPQYALLVWLFGLHTDTAHIAAAMTYTLVVIFSVLLARGRVPRREARLRMLLTAGLMFAPQLGVGVFVLLLSLGHIGTAVPLLLTWLVIDRCPARWYVPVAVGLLLTWVLIADPLVLLVGVVPLVAVCALRVSRDLARRQDTSVQAVLRARWYELSLAAAAIAAQGLASLPGRRQARGAARRDGLRAAAPGRGGAGGLGGAAGGAAVPVLAGHDQPDPARRDGAQRGRVRAEHAGQRFRPERP
jgi:hypothetical protein